MVERTTEIKTCLCCSRIIKGRTDKKYCDDYCRSRYNNTINNDITPFVRNINNVLRRNRRILRELIPAGELTARINMQRLIDKGLNFRYFTHTRTNKKGMVYSFCYEYGYLSLRNNRVLIVKSEQEV